MGGKHDPNKKMVTWWATEEEKTALQHKAKDLGYANLADLFRAIANGTVKMSIKLVIACMVTAKFTRSPMTDWSGAALADAAGTGLSWFGTGVAWTGSLAWQAGSALLGTLL